MATKDKQKLDESTLNDTQKHLLRDYREDLDAHDAAIVDFDAYEAMHMGKVFDSVSRTTSNGLTDSMTSTIYLERAARVAGKLPEGEMKAFGKKDYGKGLFMDILRTKWIYPNANAQHPFKTKMFLWQYGSSEYGMMPMYVDLNVSPNGYFGPDCWIWNPRNFIPQTGFSSIDEMDYVHAIAYKSPTWFTELLEEEGWEHDEIKKLISQIEGATRSTDPQRDTLKRRTQQKGTSRQIAVVTRYESGKDGRWITFLPDFGMTVIRDTKNPHKNGKIPFVIKNCIPTADSVYGIGDFQRSMPMQFANDGLDNFYFQGIKVSLFAPTIINSQGVVRHTIKPGEAGSVWEEIIPNSIRKHETSNAGLSTYQAAKGMARGAIQTIAGTTDTTANAESAMDPGMGKTPEALSMIGEREDTRDAQDRDQLEIAMQQLVDIMMSLILVIPNKIPVDLFSDEIEEIIEGGATDLDQIFKVTSATGLLKYRMSNSKNQIRLTIDPTKLRGLEYRFELEQGSTAKKTKEQQLQGLLDFLDFIGKMPNALQEYREATGKVLDWEYIFQQYGHLADIKNMEKFFTTAPAPVAAEEATETAPEGVPPTGEAADATDIAAATEALGGDVPPTTVNTPEGEPNVQFRRPEIAAKLAEAEALLV